MVVFLMTDPTRKHSRDGVHVKSPLSLTNTVSICRGAFTWKTKTSKTLRKCGEKKAFCAMDCTNRFRMNSGIQYYRLPEG